MRSTMAVGMLDRSVKLLLSVVEQRVIGERAAVEQDQGEAGFKPEQADGRGARGEAAGELVVLDRAGGKRLRAQHVGDVLEALASPCLRR